MSKNTDVMQIEDLLNASDLRDRVTFQSNAQTVNDYGEPVATFSDHYTCWAKMHAIKIAEKINAHETESRIKTQIYIRDCPEARVIDHTFRVCHDGKYYGILGKKRVQNWNAFVGFDCYLQDSAWHPLDMGLTAWWDETTIPVGATGLTARWNNHEDATGSTAYDWVTQTGGGITQGTLNGITCLDFDGASYIDLASEQDLGTGDISIMIIANVSSGAASTLTSSTSDGNTWTKHTNGSPFQARRGSAWGSTASNVSNGTTYAYIGYHDGTNGSNAYVGGGTGGTIAASATGSYLIGRLGASNLASLKMNGSIACAGIYPGLMTSDQRDQFYQWGNIKYASEV